MLDLVAAPAGEIDRVETTASDFAHVIDAKKRGRPPKSATQPSSHPSSSQPSLHPSSSQPSTSQSSN